MIIHFAISIEDTGVNVDVDVIKSSLTINSIVDIDRTDSVLEALYKKK